LDGSKDNSHLIATGDESYDVKLYLVCSYMKRYMKRAIVKDSLVMPKKVWRNEEELTVTMRQRQPSKI